MKAIIYFVLKSPILHFILLGTVAFVVYTRLKPPDRETIHITTQTIDALVQQRESIAQKAITPETRQSLIAGHVEDEILLREAYKRGSRSCQNRACRLHAKGSHPRHGLR